MALIDKLLFPETLKDYMENKRSRIEYSFAQLLKELNVPFKFVYELNEKESFLISEEMHIGVYSLDTRTLSIKETIVEMLKIIDGIINNEYYNFKLLDRSKYLFVRKLRDQIIAEIIKYKQSEKKNYELLLSRRATRQLDPAGSMFDYKARFFGMDALLNQDIKQDFLIRRKESEVK